jgi:hypothetical protein
VLDKPIAKGLFRANPTGIAFDELMEFDFKRRPAHGFRIGRREQVV